MRAHLIINPHATATTERRRDLLVRALSHAMDLRVERTDYRGHAAELASDAVAAGAELIVVHGGDGTVNEVVNGMLRGPHPGRPLLAVVPGGSTNVFARAVGIDPDPTLATEQILEALADNHGKDVSLGLADDRYFTFNAGLGLDAEVVRAVEKYRARGRSISNSLHIRRAIRCYFATDRKHPRLRVTIDGDHSDGIHLALISNVDPWTFAGNRPVRTNPGLALDQDLGVLALHRLRVPTVLRVLRQMLMRTAGPKSNAALRSDAAQAVIVEAEEPMALQVDGDYLGQRSRVTFTSVPRAIRVLA